MKRSLIITLGVVFAGLSANPMPLAAQDVAASGPEVDVATDGSPLSLVEQWQAEPTRIFDSIDVNLAEFRFVARPVVVMADSPNDPLFTEQMDLLTARLDELRIRDVIVITDTDPAALSAVRQELRPRGFALVLIGKDGRVAQRKPAPWSVRELTRAIDKMPLRQQEIRDGNG